MYRMPQGEKKRVVANPQEMAAMDIVPTSPTYRQVTYKRMVLAPENNFMQPNSIMYNPIVTGKQIGRAHV